MNKLLYGTKEYSGRRLMSVSVNIGDALVSETLSADTLTAKVLDYDLTDLVLAADGYPLAAQGYLLATQRVNVGLSKSYEYGDPVYYYHNTGLIGKFYVESIPRIGRDKYQFNAISAVGLLITSNYYGGVYSGITLADLVQDIVGGIIEYSMDETLGASQMFGLIRKKSRRDALQDCLFAAGAMIEKDDTGALSIVPQSEGIPYELDSSEIYMGGSVAGNTPASQVSVTEHSFIALPGDVEVTLFDGEAAAESLVTPMGRTVNGVLVEFDEPCHDLAIANGTILESGANYAVLGPSSSATLTGKQYSHTKRILTRVLTTKGTPNVVQSSACELVNLMNSENVLNRLAAYYGYATEYEMDLVVTDQKPGDAVKFEDPFGDPASGYIKDLDIVMSGILKGRATIVSGYIPTGSGNYYEHVAVITANIIFVIPAAAKDKARVVTIGGGDGGKMGEAGGRGGNAQEIEGGYGSSGKGGAPGTPGDGGKVYVETISVTPGQQFRVVIGKGGLGQTSEREATAGGATTFGTLSSANGISSTAGYANLFDGSVYALPGEEGIAGGDANSYSGGVYVPGSTITYKGVEYTPGQNGRNESESGQTAAGGLGGGPAAGKNGGNGEPGDVYHQPSGIYTAFGGGSGVGATPVKADDGKVRGQGGGAGHGGGGSGGAGWAIDTSGMGGAGWGADGGDPGPAGDGADGICLVYY